MASVESNVVDLGYLIAAPIIATVDADFMAAIKFVEYIERYGFVKQAAATDENLGRLRMVQFTFPEVDSRGAIRQRIMRLPELSMIPLPLLQVDRAEYRFGVRVVTGERPVSPGGLGLADEPSMLPSPDTYRWKAMLAPPRRGPSAEAVPDVDPYIDANIEATVSVRQADIPAGISRMLALLASSAQMVTGDLAVHPRLLTLKPGEMSSEVRMVATGIGGKEVPHLPVDLINPHAREVRVLHGGNVWESGTAVTTDDDGELRFTVHVAEETSAGKQLQLHFNALIDDGDVDSKLTVDVQAV